MSEDLISQFLLRVTYSQDEKSRKQFDEGLKAVQGKVEDFSKKVGDLPTVINEAMKKVSSVATDPADSSKTHIVIVGKDTGVQSTSTKQVQGVVSGSSSTITEKNISHKAPIIYLNC